MKQQKNLLDTINDIKNKNKMDDFTTFVEKEDGSYNIVGTNNIIELDKDLSNNLSSKFTSSDAFILLFGNKEKI